MNENISERVKTMKTKIYELLKDTGIKDYQQEYAARFSQLDQIEELVETIKINTFEEFKAVYALKGLTNSMWCFAVNNDLPEYDRISKVESIIGEKLLGFIKKSLIKDKEAKIVAKYALWGKYYTAQNLEKIYETLIKFDMIRRDTDNDLYIIGLHYKVGDNTFTVSRSGNQRNYFDSCAFQAIAGISTHLQGFISDRIEEIPYLDEAYGKVYQENAKGGIRSIALSKKECKVIISKYCV